MEDPWDFVLVLLVCLLILALVIGCNVAQAWVRRAERDCRANGYVDYEYWNEGQWCVGMRDGQPYLVPLATVNAEK